MNPDELEKLVKWIWDNPDERHVYIPPVTDPEYDAMKKFYQQMMDDSVKKEDVPVTNTNTVDVKSVMFTARELKEIDYLKKQAQSTSMAIGLIGFDSSIVIAGGCFASWLNNEYAKDIDVFILNPSFDRKTDILETLKHLHRDLRNATKNYVRDNINITDVYMDDRTGLQFIFTTYNTREELVKHFDYVHCMVSYHHDKLYLTRGTFDAIKQKHLIVNNKNNVAQWRREKFLSRGWRDPIADALGEMSESDFNAKMRQPAQTNDWLTFARRNPVRELKMASPQTYMDHVITGHIDKLLEELERDGQ
jgi:hypothetical protein